MKKLLNTLYITTPDSYISKDGMNIVISNGGQEIGRLPIHNIQQIICFNYSGVSPYAMQLCVENGVSLSYLTPHGKYLASVYGETKGNVLLRREQYRMADQNEIALKIARNMILGKIANCRYLLKKSRNDHKNVIDLKTVDEIIFKLDSSISDVKSAASLETLRGIEGDAAKKYFVGFDNMILQSKKDFFMRCRNRRLPRDRVNALLSFIYSLLMNDVKSALESVGLDSYVGFFHTDRPGRPSLALDLMEEMRPVADRAALTLINLRMISPKGFLEKENGALIMDDETRRIVINSWQSRKSDIIFHPYINEKISIGLLPFVQSMLLSRYIRGDINGYPPYIMK